MNIRTGVTAILPHDGNIFREKVTATAHIINAFGKSIGLAQLLELGNIETPILLTNTLNVWLAADALVDYVSAQNPNVYSFNPIVGECNDSFLNDTYFDTDFNDYYPYRFVMKGMLEHDLYHLGQIGLLKNLMNSKIH